MKIHEIENFKKKKIIENKGWFSEKIKKKINKLLVRLTKKKIRLISKMKEGPLLPINKSYLFTELKRIIKEHYELN